MWSGIVMNLREGRSKMQGMTPTIEAYKKSRTPKTILGVTPLDRRVPGGCKGEAFMERCEIG
jgi:hypothetical protein